MGRPASPDYCRRWRAAYPAYRERERERGRARRRAEYRSPKTHRARVDPEAAQPGTHLLPAWAHELASGLVRADRRVRLSDELYPGGVGDSS